MAKTVKRRVGGGCHHGAMAKGLSYLDAVKILGGSGPLATVADNLLGGLLSVATAGGSEAALSFFDAKAEMVRLGSLVLDRGGEIVRGLGRHERSERLLAAHGVLVVASVFEALDDCLRMAGLDPAGLSGPGRRPRPGPPAERIPLTGSGAWAVGPALLRCWLNPPPAGIPAGRPSVR